MTGPAPKNGLDAAAIGARLEALSDDETAVRQRKQHRCLRGIRGVPFGDLARLADERWRECPTALPRDAAALERLFGTAWEDGLLAVGLLATAVAADPEASRDLALRLAERVDDPVTADALGWLVIGPLAAHLRLSLETLTRPLAAHGRPEVRRIVVAAALAYTPTPIEGPAAAPLRAMLGQSRVRISDRVDRPTLGWALSRFAKDDGVVRSVRRLLTVWGTEDPEGLHAWVAGVPGGLPSVLAAEYRRFRRSS